MRRVALFLSSAVIAVVVSYFSLFQEKYTESSYDTPVYAFTAYLTEKEHSLVDNRGKLQLIHFWAPWCAPCIKEIGELIDFAQNHYDKVKLLLIAGDTTKDQLDAFLDKHLTSEQRAAITSDSVYLTLDTSDDVAKHYFEVYQYPGTIILDLEGKSLEKISGPMNIEAFKQRFL